MKNYLLLKRLEILLRGHVISDRKGEQIFGTFYQKELQKANQKEVRVLNGKSKIVLLTVGLIKKT